MRPHVRAAELPPADVRRLLDGIRVTHFLVGQAAGAGEGQGRGQGNEQGWRVAANVRHMARMDDVGERRCA